MPKNGKRLYKVTATDIDWLPENKNVSFSITSEKIIRLSENRNLRMEKSQVFLHYIKNSVDFITIIKISQKISDFHIRCWFERYRDLSTTPETKNSLLRNNGHRGQ